MFLGFKAKWVKGLRGWQVAKHFDKICFKSEVGWVVGWLLVRKRFSSGKGWQRGWGWLKGRIFEKK